MRGARARSVGVFYERVTLGVDHERWRLGRDEVFELTPELVHRQTRRRCE